MSSPILFKCLLYFCVTKFDFIPLLKVSPHGKPVVTGVTNKPIPMTENVTEVDVVAVMANVSKVFETVDDSLFD